MPFVDIKCPHQCAYAGAYAGAYASAYASAYAGAYASSAGVKPYKKKTLSGCHEKHIHVRLCEHEQM